MRVISGTARGLKLKSPDGLNTRPTTDRVKESVFNIINFRVRESSVLDIFAGSGALGIESLSRGAKSCMFVDASKESVRLIDENLKKARLEQRATLFNLDINAAFSRIQGKKFDIVFMDPPYGKGFIEPAIREIANRDLLEADGIIVVEHDSNDQLQEKIGKIVRFDERTYGKTKISFYKLEE